MTYGYLTDVLPWTGCFGGDLTMSCGETPVRTMIMVAPQHGQVSVGRGLSGGGVYAGLIGTSTWIRVIKRLQLGCRKPKLRARRKPFGITWRSTSARKSTAGKVRYWSVRVWNYRGQGRVVSKATEIA